MKSVPERKVCKLLAYPGMCLVQLPACRLLRDGLCASLGGRGKCVKR